MTVWCSSIRAGPLVRAQASCIAAIILLFGSMPRLRSSVSIVAMLGIAAGENLLKAASIAGQVSSTIKDARLIRQA